VNSSNTSVILVHALALFREGLRHNVLTIPGFRVVGEASNGQQAIQLVGSVDVDLMLMDVDLPGVSGLEVSRVIKRNHPHISIVLFGSTMDGQNIVKAIRAGVSAYAMNTVSWEHLRDTICAVCDGNYPINDLVLSQSDVASQVLTEFRQLAMDGDTQHIYSPLSLRELQILELVANDWSNKEIASSLEISNQTVKNHISSILRKLAVNDRTQAVVYAIRQGWIKAASPAKESE
jgi:DNA-binding NarL/FixJ family response regulator